MKTSTGAPAIKKLTKIAAPAIFWLGLWQLVASYVNQPLYLPSPLAVCGELVTLAGTGRFWRFTAMTLLRVLLGAASGVVLGTVLAVLTFRSRLADAILSPALRLVRAAPVVSFILLVLLWVKTGIVPGVICALMVLPVIWESVGAGLRSASPELLELGSAYRMSGLRRAKYIYLPAVRPAFLSGLLSSIGLAWKSGVAAEVLCVPRQAIGTQVYYAKLYLDTPALFAWTAVVILLSLILETLAGRALRRWGGGQNADT